MDFSRHIMRASAAALILALVIFSFGARRTTAADHVLIFNHVTVIDATGSAPQKDMTVVISGDRISAIAGTIDERQFTNAEMVDATGKFLIPGLWDMHVHWYDEDYLPLFIAEL